jgi:hypothetical protein
MVCVPAESPRPLATAPSNSPLALAAVIVVSAKLPGVLVHCAVADAADRRARRAGRSGRAECSDGQRARRRHAQHYPASNLLVFCSSVLANLPYHLLLEIDDERGKRYRNESYGVK